MSVFTNEDLVTVVGTVVVDGSGVTQPVSGTVNVGNFPATQPVSGPLTDTQLRATPVPVSGPLTDAQLRAVPVPVSGTVSVGAPTTLATVTNISVGTSVITLSASNASKKRVHVYNETGTLFVKLGSAASASSYTFRLTANTALEITDYAGLVTAIKQSGTTAVLVTEIGI